MAWGPEQSSLPTAGRAGWREARGWQSAGIVVQGERLCSH